MLGFPILASRLAEAQRWVVHVVPSRRLCQVEAEDGWVDVTGCIGSFYPRIIGFYVLGSMGIVVFYSFAWAYKLDPRGMGLLATSLVSFRISYIRSELRTNFYSNNHMNLLVIHVY
jgi:hypothetical protein